METATSEEVAWAIRQGADLLGFDVIHGMNPQLPLKAHQVRAVAWMYFQPKCMILDQVGTGKTASALGLLQLLRNHGDRRRAIVICPAANVYGTWATDGFQKFVPDMPYAVAASGIPTAKRSKIYQDPSWDVLLTNHEMFWRDIDQLADLDFNVVVFDEADVLRKKSNKAYKAMKKLCAKAERVVLMTATPINNKLADLHSLLCLIGIDHLVGDSKEFQRRYIDVTFDQIGYGTKKKFIPRVVGHKNLDELKQIIGPYYMRRTKADIPDADIPDLSAQDKWFELNSRQADLYRRIQNAVTDHDLRDRISMEAIFLRLRQCCTSTALIDPALGDHSAKMDWLVNQLVGDWQGEKVVVFSTWKESLALLAKRLDAVGVGHVTMMSGIKHETREENRQKFINDPDCRVVLGTSAIEKGLNLQVARTQVNLDLLFNPQRHEQLAGRVVRTGSAYDLAFVFSLLAAGTVDEHVIRILAKKAALSNFMWDDASDLMTNLASNLTNQELAAVIGRPYQG